MQDSIPKYTYNLGTHSRKISTNSKQAQAWFDQGLIWCYGFNHEKAVSCFRNAIEEDQTCAMAYWGVAYARGPNYNKPWEVFDKGELANALKTTRDAAESAKKNSTNTTPSEKALIDAIQHRYPRNDRIENHMEWNIAYSKAMGEVYDAFSDDLDIVTLYADSLMNLSPWALWDIHTGKPVKDAPTMKVKSVLDTALSTDQGKAHPGLLHLYIHLMEMSPHPEAAMLHADRLRDLVPDAGHLQHMPTHLDILCGDYRRAIASNTSAIVADEKFLANEGGLNFYSLYRCHDYHFRIYAAMFAGQFEVAIATAQRIEETLPEALLRQESPPMADWLESFFSLRIHVLVRFGKWDELLALALPSDQKLFCNLVAMIYYGKAIAYAVTGKVALAEETQKLFREAVTKVKPTRTLFNNTCLSVLTIADAMLAGELEYRRKNFDAAFAHLRHAIELDDNLPYDEPWGWMQPPRHAYGALLLQQRRVEEATKAYEADLGYDDSLPRALQHPGNVWAMVGYLECLVRLKRNGEANILRKEVEMKKAMADVKIDFSCYCRTHDSDAACCF